MISTTWMRPGQHLTSVVLSHGAPGRARVDRHAGPRDQVLDGGPKGGQGSPTRASTVRIAASSPSICARCSRGMEEPSAGKPHARICEGEAEWLSYSTTTTHRRKLTVLIFDAQDCGPASPTHGDMTLQ